MANSSLNDLMFEEEESGKTAYLLFFKPKAFGANTRLSIVNAKTELSEKEANQLNTAYGKLMVSKTGPIKPNDDELYIAIYQDDLAKQERSDYYVKKGDLKSDQKVNMTAGEFFKYRDKFGIDSVVPADIKKKRASYDETYIRFLTITESEYEKIKSDSSVIKDFEIRKPTPEEILKFAKAEPIKDGKKGISMSLFSMTDTIERLKEKQASEKRIKDIPEKEPTKQDDVSKEAIDFLYDNDRIVSSIIASYQIIKGKIEKIRDRIDKREKDKKDSEEDGKSVFKKSGDEEVEERAYKNVEEKINVLLDKIKEQDPEVMFKIVEKMKPKFQSASAMGAYVIIKKELENPIKESMKNKVKEMSTTGTGATATPGEGEGMATKYAFAGAGASPKKKKKIKEEMDSEDEMYKAEAVYDLIKNTVMNMTIKKATANLPKIKEFQGNVKKASEGMNALADKFESSDIKKAKKFNEMSSNITTLDDILSKLVAIYEKAQTNLIK
jgi:hypothetical protein